MPAPFNGGMTGAVIKEVGKSYQHIRGDASVGPEGLVGRHSRLFRPRSFQVPRAGRLEYLFRRSRSQREVTANLAPFRRDARLVLTGDRAGFDRRKWRNGLVSTAAHLVSTAVSDSGF